MFFTVMSLECPSNTWWWIATLSCNLPPATPVKSKGSRTVPVYSSAHTEHINSLNMEMTRALRI